MKRIIAFFRKQRKMEAAQPETRTILINYPDGTVSVVPAVS